MSEFEERNKRIKPLKFQALAEDGSSKLQANRNESWGKDTSLKRSKVTIDDGYAVGASKRQGKLEPNFTFEHSYPAVIFDELCFTVDKSQQQANFLQECIARIESCFGTADQEKIQILKSINLTVPYGSIFGLLGPSSCGKTTLLRCLVGLLRPSSGHIRLFGRSLEVYDDDNDDERLGGGQSSRGRKSGCGCRSANLKPRRSSQCGVPGRNVGYMPQDLGLYEDFTIKQLLTMFGRYMGMDSKLIETRIDFMATFLDLPNVDREICSLSGGQKRRVSFAIACLHMPPLIILDEPTVGVDPLLRKSIWKYLRRLANEENKTIIITTHYIEEAAQADQVAFMRAGEILIQDTPIKIMESNGCKTLEEAFLKICNNVQTQESSRDGSEAERINSNGKQCKLYPQPRFNWHDKLERSDGSELVGGSANDKGHEKDATGLNEKQKQRDALVRELKLKAQAKMALFDDLQKHENQSLRNPQALDNQSSAAPTFDTLDVGKVNKLSMAPSSGSLINEPLGKRKIQLIGGNQKLSANSIEFWLNEELKSCDTDNAQGDLAKIKLKKRSSRKTKLVICDRIATTTTTATSSRQQLNSCDEFNELSVINKDHRSSGKGGFKERLNRGFSLCLALLYKNYRRNVNSLPLLAFQFMLPVIQMISFSLCVGGRPTNIGLGLVNLDQPLQFDLYRSADLLLSPSDSINSNFTSLPGALNSTELLDYEAEESEGSEELLSKKYLSFIDTTMLSIKPYDNLKDALNDVRQAKLWAAMEIGENFTVNILRRFDLENFYQLDRGAIKQSIIKLYPDRSNKVLDMICHRSLVNSYRKFLSDQFEHFKRLPIEVKEAIFDIKPNLISNSIDGYTESIAAGLLASLTYIMAAGLTTFIMVVERSGGILERTFTTGINPVYYLLAHAVFRSFVMMLQIGVVLFLTFYILQQPLVGSIWLAYLMLMTLNLTGISYGLLISSMVTDQNGAALAIVSSLVVKITMSGILWPFEAIPRWLRTICYIQPLTMPIQALKSITLKGGALEDRTVQLGFAVSLTWLTLFLTIAAKRFKFYQH